jgi:NADPH:quinone reductase-like Zn-dependent oxidoreductase
VYRNHRLNVETIEKPEIKDNEILVRVRAATVTPSDIVGMGSLPVIRFLTSARPRYAIPGVEFSGNVVAVGNSVTLFKPGDEVLGSSGVYGAWAEYICIREGSVLVPKPKNLSFGEAACLCDGALTAYNFLKNHADIKKGQSVLINGASGAVGTYAVQLAAYFGAKVTGVCSAANAELVKSLGARSVTDYTKEDFTASGKTYDVIFDAVAKSSYARCERSLKPSGIYMTTIPTPGMLVKTQLTKNSSGKRAVFSATGLSKRSARIDALHFLTELAEKGALKTVIDRKYALEQLPQARDYVAKGHKRGNVIIAVRDNI